MGENGNHGGAALEATPLPDEVRQALWAAIGALENEATIARRNATQRGRYHLQEAAAGQLRRAQRAERHRDVIRELLRRTERPEG